MKQYTVKWGDESQLVDAENEQDAWAVFSDAHDLARKHPKLHEREVTEVAAEVAETQKAPFAKGATVEGTSPVIGDTAELAIEEIGRMRSAERLQKIIDHDPRSTVVHAAQKRLLEL